MQARLFDLHHATVSKLSRLRKEAEQDGAYRVAKRIHAVILCARGRTSGEIASFLDAPRSKVSLWLKRYEEDDLVGILEGDRSGRPKGLSAEDQMNLADIIESGPLAYGFPGGVWTSPMVARVIEEECGIAYHPGHVRKILYQLGFSVQRPRRELSNADPRQINRWKRFTYPEIKKKHNQKVGSSSLRMKRASGRIQPSLRPGRVVDTSQPFR